MLGDYHAMCCLSFVDKENKRNFSSLSNEIVCFRQPVSLQTARSKFVKSFAQIIHLLFHSLAWSIPDEKSVRIIFSTVSPRLSQKKFWVPFNWETRERGDGQPGFRASPSVSLVSIQTRQSIHICIDLLWAPGEPAQARVQGPTHTHTLRQRNVRSVCPWSCLMLS